MSSWRKHAGWCAALFFVCIGFMFANGLSLMEHVERWPELWNAHSTAGAATGTALNIGDPDALAPLALDVRPGARNHGRLGAGGCGLADPRHDRRSLPGLGVGIRQKALHVRNALGRRRRRVVRLPHVAGRLRDSHVRMAAHCC